MSELSLVLETLTNARCPEDVFGGSLQTSFRSLLRAVHPDHNKNDPLAVQATVLLNELKTVAEERVAAGTWGNRLPLPAFETIELGGYSVTRKPVVGDVADVYLGELHVVKVTRNTDDNDLMRAERQALTLLGTKVTTVVRSGFPKVLHTFQSGRRETNVLERTPGFITAAEVHSRLPVLEGRALVWMFKRLLMMLDWTHHYGIVHGAILPPHVLFYPDNDGATTNPHPYKHTARLIDWCYSVEYKNRTRLSSWIPAWKDHYPPELLLKQSVGPSSDIYMAAMLMFYLGRGNTPHPLYEVLLKCTEQEPALRYQKAEDVFRDWTAAARAVYGAPKWVDFNLPK